MTSISIKVENLSKAYQLGEIGTGTISRDLERWWARMRGNPDPFLKIGASASSAQANDRTQKATKNEMVWSLKDLNFEIEQGQAVGIIGRNGAGKSTLLKILSRVTSPTTGSVKLKGRVASLLEVGTGFHPELTGRENIFLNGAILGMRKAEIKRKFDEIVAFAGVDKYIDTPVKRYSSGMYVRLAFAVAAHLESEILIVDEVLAVGDAEFQKKCLGKMNDVSKNEGRTVLFVSHNMGAVKQLCSKGILLKNGQVDSIENIDSIVNNYINLFANTEKNYLINGNLIPKKLNYFEKIYLTDNIGLPKSDFDVFDDIVVNLNVTLFQVVHGLKISVTIQNKSGDYLATLLEDLTALKEKGSGLFNLKIRINKELIAPNNYYIRCALFMLNGEVYDLVEMICPFKIHDTGTLLAQIQGIDYGNFLLKYDKEFKKLS